MDSDNDSYDFPKCQTHAYTRFENGCSENSTQNLFTKYSTEKNNKHVICRPRSANNIYLLYLLVSTRAVIGQFSGPYSPVRPAKI